MTTPLRHLLEWFKQLPLKYQQDLASEVAVLLPGITVNPYHRTFLDDFLKQLDVIKKKGVKEEYGLFVCLKAVIDNIVTLKNKENANWEKEKNELDDLVKMTGSCSFATHASEKAMQYDEWKAIDEKWTTLVTQYLTFDRIDRWQASLVPFG